MHHRDDTEETRQYNKEHYELWGFNLDGTFEYGRYIVFMTRADHMRHHRTGVVSPSRGKHRSEETKERMRVNSSHYWKGKQFSDEHRRKISNNNARYWAGKTLSDETKAKLRANPNVRYWKDKHLSEETRAKISDAVTGDKNPMFGKKHTEEAKVKISMWMKTASVIYAKYKNNGGTLKWGAFQTALKNGDIVDIDDTN